VGIADPDALPNSERPSPAAPITVTAAVLVVRFRFEACLTRGMVASSVLVTHLAWHYFGLKRAGAAELNIAVRIMERPS
jgi:hypothetical protein